MRYRLLKFLRCPGCQGALTPYDVHEVDDADVAPGAFDDWQGCSFEHSAFFPHHDPATAGALCWRVNIVSGELRCTSCAASYPVRNGVPRMSSYSADEPQDLRVIKTKTANSFGFEWQFYSDWGWSEQRQTSVSAAAGREGRPTKNVETDSFLKKALAAQPEFAGKLVLDAGCGNGRYSYQAMQLGAEVIGVDLSEAVDAAAGNLRRYPNVHIVQGDIFQLPLARQVFDRVFSIGVLMHTGDARRAFASLVSHLKPDGVIAVHVYRKGNVIYEYLDQAIRARTVNMEHRRLMELSERLARIGRGAWHSRKVTFGSPVLYSLLNCFVRLESKTHNVFDWYSAPAASHHTYEEVHGWFLENACDVVADRNRRKNLALRILSSPAAGVTVKGVLKSSAEKHIQRATAEGAHQLARVDAC